MRLLSNIGTVFVLVAISLLSFTATVKATEIGSASFYVNRNYDAYTRQSLQVTLIKTTTNLYFYVENNWWNSQNQTQKDAILSDLDSLSDEFNNNIYPKLTSVFGNEWKPGIDYDNRITVLFHEMKSNITGYFRSGDEYAKLQDPSSNEREMVYLSIGQIESPKLKEFLAHEFVHLIEFNQKERIQDTQEEVWLNEARADYASTILGYDDVYEGSNLQRRVKDFLQKPDDSLTEWQDTKYDYATVNLFTHYLVDHYGLGILSNSLKFKSVGIKSIDQALLESGVNKNFAEIFMDWTVTLVVNNCSINPKYCYISNNLNNLRINAALIFLPVTGNSSLLITNFTKDWSGNWQKIVGGSGDLKLEFSTEENLHFQISYVLLDKSSNYSVKFLKLDNDKKGQINIENFNNLYSSIIIIPSSQTKIEGFNGLETSHPYDLTISSKQSDQENPLLIQKLLAQIESLKKQIAALQLGNGLNQNTSLCSNLNNNLYFGLANSNEVRCLQQFLKNQGEDVYPEGFITGNFGNLTKSAVIRFQKKYGIFQTGFVGILTRTKINQLLK